MESFIDKARKKCFRIPQYIQKFELGVSDAENKVKRNFIDFSYWDVIYYKLGYGAALKKQKRLK